MAFAKRHKMWEEYGYITFLIGFRNRLVVMFNWAWDYFFYDNQVRLITRE